MDSYFRNLNAFIEDTCVLVAFAYLLARGPMLGLLFREPLTSWQAAYLGSVLGLVGLTEAAFPGARFPYATHTLIVTFAVLAGGLPVGLVAATVVAIGALILREPQTVPGTICAVLASACVSAGVRGLLRARHPLGAGAAAGVLSQLVTVVSGFSLGRAFHSPYSLPVALRTIPANGFGVLLLLLVVKDAQIRAESERHRAEAERAHALVAEARLNALRARVHPHFLFNTLTSIAALCGVAPDRAEAAIVRLGHLMRRALEAKSTTPATLREEIEYVQGYLDIEQLRYGDRLRVAWKVGAGCEEILVPPFAVQILVENAVQHGIAKKMKPGDIVIAVRRYPHHALVAVADDGVGMTAEARRMALPPEAASVHGLPILTQQLTQLYHRRARLRLFSRPDVGTLAVFVVPTQERHLRLSSQDCHDSADH